jgi:uracil DNA glycosylase
MTDNPSPDDPLALTELFRGGGEPWLPLLKPAIERLPDAPTFIGPKRPKTIVPVRELTFQALKPNPPERWQVVIFGQNPYPRVESATGIAMFDNTFHNWKDSQFGRVMSIRCILKAACMWKHGISKQTPIADIRQLLAGEKTVQPPEWFQAMLTQGVLLLNAALTASSDGALSTGQHTAFWQPVVEKIVEEILKAKETADARHRGVVFAWWGSHARALRGVVERLQKKYPGVPVKHVDHCNPAAQGDIFCNGNHFADVNAALRALGLDEIDWLPAVGWDQDQAEGEDTAGRMGDFIAQTMELHKFYLERLQEVKDEVAPELPAIIGVLATPLMTFPDAAAPLVKLLGGLGPYVSRSYDFGQKNAGTAAAGGLSAHEIAALYLYTCESLLYRQMNATLRLPDRDRVRPYFPYLRLFFAALSKLQGHKGSLWRGVALDLRGQYPAGGTVTWWGVSSCTSKLAVAQGFLGTRGRRMLFEVTPVQAVSIRRYSAFTGEEEYILPPGTQLKVTDVQSDRAGLCTVKLEELAGKRLVS